MANFYATYSNVRLKTNGNAIEGLDSIKRAMKDLTVREIHSINLSACRAGARKIEKAAAANLPARHKKKLGIRRAGRRTRRGQRVAFNIGPLRGHAGLRFLEYGAAPHELSVKKGVKSKMRIQNEAGFSGEEDMVFIAKGVVLEHPGIEPTYFLSRGLHQGREAALAAMGKQYWKRIKAVKAKKR